MAKKQASSSGWGFGVVALILIFVISSCNKGEKATKPAEQDRPVVSRVAQEKPKIEPTRPSTLYNAVAPAPEPIPAKAPPASKAVTTSKKTHSSTASKPRNKQATRHSEKRSYAAGPCPCSRALNCVGPRGGRYCITSGGNKRYR